MNTPQRLFNNNINLCVCIHQHSATKHKELTDHMREYTAYYAGWLTTQSTKLHVVQAKSIDDGLKKFADRYDHILFMAAGVRLFSGSIINDIATEIEAHPDYLAAAHILDWTWQNRWYELHEQFVLINSRTWKEIGRPEFGTWTEDEKELPVIERSEENFHDNYTPLWIKDSGKRKVQHYSCPGWNLIDTGLRFGCEIINWNLKIRLQRTYYYPEGAEQLLWNVIKNNYKPSQEEYKKLIGGHQQFLNLIFNGVQDQIWIINSEDMYIQNNGDDYDTVALPASGFKWLECFHSNALKDNGNIVFYDWNMKALDWIQHIKKSQATDIVELIRTFKDWKHLTWYGMYNKPILQDNKDINPAFMKSFKRTLEYFGGEKQFWKYIAMFRNTDMTFMQADVIKQPENIIKHFHGKTLFHVSNIFSTDWLVAKYGFSGAIKLFNDLQIKLFSKPGIKLTGYSPNQINNNYAIISDTSMIKEL